MYTLYTLYTYVYPVYPVYPVFPCIPCIPSIPCIPMYTLYTVYKVYVGIHRYTGYTGYTWVYRVYRVYRGIQGIQGDKPSITITWRIYPFGVSVTWKNNHCVGARLKFCRRSRVPKTGSRDEAVDYITTAPPPNLTRLLHNTASYAG